MADEICSTVSRPYVFLSYSHNDREKVEPIYRFLKEEGFQCWIDHEIRAMENFNSAIEDAIENCHLFLTFCSRSYMEKHYCRMEYDCAINNAKSRMVVCLDDITPGTDRDKKYFFSYYIGANILGYGCGVNGDEDSLREFSRKIAQSTYFMSLKRLMEGDSTYQPPLHASDELLAQVRQYTKSQYSQGGNYIFSHLNRNLFPVIVEKKEISDSDPSQDDSGKTRIIRQKYADPTGEQVSLVHYLLSAENSGRNLFLIGEGGNGKTVSLLQTCEFLLGQNRCALYIPLKQLNERTDIDEYLEKAVFPSSGSLMLHFRDLLRGGDGLTPNITFLLDGVNETDENVFRRVVSFIKERYIAPGLSAQFIITSRFDSRRDFKLSDFALLEMQRLEDPSITAYLESCGLAPITDAKLLSVIRTPLLLTLYAETEKFREEYQSVGGGIRLEANPDTPGKVLHNFFQTQLYRAKAEETFNFTEQLVILDLLLPFIAYRMTREPGGYLDSDDAWECADQLEGDFPLYKWYRKHKLRRIVGDRIHVDTDYLLTYAENSLHFIRRTEEGYEFIHQIFRDYFAAFHVANIMQALLAEKLTPDDADLPLTSQLLPEDILRFTADILHEEEAAPRLEADGWIFPGKSGTAPSSLSCTEQLLSLWRNKEGKQAQTAVCNLVEILRLGRNNSLAWCDFSLLDLRGCWLNTCRFVEWYEDRIYPSTFDHAWLNRECFINNGHGISVSALCTDGGSLLFSGNMNGIVKIYDCDAGDWIQTLQPDSSPVVDLAWYAPTRCLAILYENVLFLYSMAEKAMLSVTGNETRAKCFRYVRFNEDGTPEVSYDLEPLLWYRTDGTPLPSLLQYDVPARNARWHPTKKEFIRSNLLQLISACVCNEKTGLWEAHPVLAEKLQQENARRKEENLPLIQSEYLKLRDDGAEGKDSINCLCYNEDGSRFLVAIQKLLLEYDSDTLQLIHRKTFPSHVESACYGNGFIAAASGIHVYLLDPNFDENRILEGTQIRPIGPIVTSPTGDSYYIVSFNGECKQLDANLVVQRIRLTNNRAVFVWARDRRTGRLQMAFQPDARHPGGMRYTYDTAQSEPLGWCYEFVDPPAQSDEQRVYSMKNQLMAVEKKPPYKKILYDNYTGIWIFGCSFADIRGNLAEESNQKFLYQNGGILDGNENRTSEHYPV